ncbi:MAG: hypothetical protein SNJ59_09200 [Aggregatilineales bacterium]
MISRRLWQALIAPPAAHPLMHVHVAPTSAATSQRRRWRGLLLIGLGVVVIAAFQLAVGINFDLLTIALVVALSAGTLFSLNFVGTIADSLARARAGRAFDVYSTLPPGPFGAAWLMALGQLHIDQVLLRIYRSIQTLTKTTIALVILLAPAYIVIMSSFAQIAITRPSDVELIGEILLNAVTLLVLARLVLFDFTRSVVTAVLLALIVPARARGPADAQALAVGSFVSTQFGIYVISAAALFLILPTALAPLGLSPLLTELLLLAPRVLIFVLIREALVVVLWRSLLNLYEIPYAAIPSPGGLQTTELDADSLRTL